MTMTVEMEIISQCIMTYHIAIHNIAMLRVVTGQFKQSSSTLFDIVGHELNAIYASQSASAIHVLESAFENLDKNVAITTAIVQKCSTRIGEHILWNSIKNHVSQFRWCENLTGEFDAFT